MCVLEGLLKLQAAHAHAQQHAAPEGSSYIYDVDIYIIYVDPLWPRAQLSPGAMRMPSRA